MMWYFAHPTRVATCSDTLEHNFLSDSFHEAQNRQNVQSNRQVQLSDPHMRQAAILEVKIGDGEVHLTLEIPLKGSYKELVRSDCPFRQMHR